MEHDRPDSPPLPLEMRVHGVGGPQAVKMLGELHEEDIVTVPSFPVPKDAPGSATIRMPTTTESRFAQRLANDQTEAYEWGALTAASFTKALWIIYLPLTLINAGGWAHASDRPVTVANKSRGVRWSVRLHLRLSHIAAFFGTLTYVGWIGYLTLELVARAWVSHVQYIDRDKAGLSGLTEDIILVWVPRLAPLVCVLVVVALFVSPVHKGRFEEVTTGAPEEVQKAKWPRVTKVADPGFFAHKGSYGRAQRYHLCVAAVGLVAVLGQYMLGWNQLGVALLGLAAVQALLVAALIIVDVTGRWRRQPSEVFASELLQDPHVDNDGARMPAGAAFVTLGTALAHSAFAGLAVTLSPFLARWPRNFDKDKLPVGAELGATDVLAWAVVLLVVFTLVILALSPKPPAEPNQAGTAQPGIPVRLARQAPRLGVAALLAVVIPVGVYIGLNTKSILDQNCEGWGKVSCWYDRYEVRDDAVAKRLGSFVLLLIPGAAYGVLARKHESGVGRVIGNVWDVLTFWPRRFQPYAAPCSAERAVPELRARIQYVSSRLGAHQKHFVVVAHSQGSVLSAAAIASLPAAVAPSLVTFGSPLGTLYSPTWPCYIPPLLADLRDRVNSQHPTTPWVNFWRSTDPIGAEVPCADNKHLPEPQAIPVPDLEAIGKLRPLERPTRWGTVAGHGRYLADPTVQAEIKVRRA